MKRSIYLAFAALVLVPLLFGCGEKNQYKRNVDYLSDSFLYEERQARTLRVDEANAKLAQAVAGGDKSRIEQAQAEYQIAWERLEIVSKQIREREQRRPPAPVQNTNRTEAL